MPFPSGIEDIQIASPKFWSALKDHWTTQLFIFWQQDKMFLKTNCKAGSRVNLKNIPKSMWVCDKSENAFKFSLLRPSN